MKILHWMRKETSGLAWSTLELAKYEEKQGHQVGIRQPSEHMPIYGRVNGDCDIHSVHSQLNIDAYTDRKPKMMWMHGEPISSVGNGISMKAIIDLAPKIDAFICMRREEYPVWSTIKRTHLVRKGIDLERFHKIPEVVEKLSGEPAVLYAENWRGSRNPLYLCVAMEKVHQKFPNARLHLYNCPNEKMRGAFDALIKNNKWWTFIRTLQGPQEDINLLYNKVDILVSCLFPLYARGIEAFGAGKAFIGPGYREYDDYPWTCTLDPDSMADAIIRCWEGYDKINYRKWAEEHHDVNDTVRQSVEIYGKYL